ncbi:Putative lipoprotein [hydrothermal vent metagenome]|uniref:Putative lipoprotein n=1 Tax=hydrothermal vent metagenome TaxID=652676 RepID=A0A1W1C6A2_9ZZZZ
MIKEYTWLGVVVAIVLFSGCSGKKYFEPTQTYKASGAISGHKGKSLYLTRDGVTFNNQTYISKKGAGSLILSKGDRYIGENGSFVLVTNIEGKLSLISKKSKKISKTIEFNVPVVSASIKGNKIVYLLQDNTFGIYNTSSDEKIIESKSDDTFAVDARIANPMFVDNLAVIPTLDGKILIVDINNPENAKVIYISSKANLNNVIYLSRMGNLLVAATPNRVMTIGSAEGEFDDGISEVAISNGAIYVFTKAGEIVKFSKDLKALARAKFKFAHFSVATAFGGRVYAMDQQGSLIVLSADLKKHRIYDVGEVKDFAFISGNKIYKDNKVITLSKLSYE